MEVLATNELIRDVNIFYTAYHPTELMLYFEKHHIFEIIFDLLILLDQKRPDDIRMFIAENINKIADKYRKINIAVNCPHSLELEKLVQVYQRVQVTPVIQVKRPSSNRCLKKLPQELKRFRLNCKNILFIGKDQNVSEGQLAKDFHFNRCIDLGNKCNEEPNNLKTILPIVYDLKNTLNLLERRENHQYVKYVERIAIVGRPGSGKHHQARLLANRLDLVLISVNTLVERARQKRNYFKNTLELGLEDNVHTSELITTIVQKRLLEPDCLQFGWVMVDFPNTAEDVENLFNLLIAPQVVVVLHTNTRLCWKRLMSNKSSKQPQGQEPDQLFREEILRSKLDYFEMHKTGTLAALEEQNCVLVDVNGNQNVENLHGDILTKLLKVK